MKRSLLRSLLCARAATQQWIVRSRGGQLSKICIAAHSVNIFWRTICTINIIFELLRGFTQVQRARQHFSAVWFFSHVRALEKPLHFKQQVTQIDSCMWCNCLENQSHEQSLMRIGIAVEVLLLISNAHVRLLTWFIRTMEQRAHTVARGFLDS
jgi:hypothetical protein